MEFQAPYRLQSNGQDTFCHGEQGAEMRYLKIIFNRAIPFYLWIGIFYAIFVLVMSLTTSETPAAPQPDATVSAPAADAASAEATTAAAAEADECPIIGEQLYQRVESALRCPIVTIPLFSAAEFTINWTVVFILLGFISAWIEVVRATNIRDTARNDTWSLVVTIIAFVLFVGVSSFGTTAFMIVAVVGFGDVLLDRYVGQAVARRDFGGMMPGGH